MISVEFLVTSLVVVLIPGTGAVFTVSTGLVQGPASPLAQLLVLSAVFMLMTFVVFVVYGFVAHASRKAVIESPRGLRRGFAGAFAGLGAQLALSERWPLKHKKSGAYCIATQTGPHVCI